MYNLPSLHTITNLNRYGYEYNRRGIGGTILCHNRNVYYIFYIFTEAPQRDDQVANQSSLYTSSAIRLPTAARACSAVMSSLKRNFWNSTIRMSVHCIQLTGSGKK